MLCNAHLAYGRPDETLGGGQRVLNRYNGRRINSEILAPLLAKRTTASAAHFPEPEANLGFP